MAVPFSSTSSSSSSSSSASSASSILTRETIDYLEAFADPSGRGEPKTKTAGPIRSSEGLRFITALRRGPHWSSRASDHVRAISIVRDADGLHWCFPMRPADADIVDSLTFGQFSSGKAVRGVWQWDPIAKRAVLVQLLEAVGAFVGLRGQPRGRGRACRGPTVDDVIAALPPSDPRVFFRRVRTENPAWMRKAVDADLGPHLWALERLAKTDRDDFDRDDADDRDDGGGDTDDDDDADDRDAAEDDAVEEDDKDE